jgi:rhamnosyltransferase subunit B
VRILLATFGSLGDLHPAIALGLELQRRGHHAAIVSSEYHRPRIVAAGLPFQPAVPDLRPDDKALIQATMDERRGPEEVFKYMLAHLPATYADYRRAIDLETPDLLITSELAYAGPILAEQLGLQWASMTLSPLSFISAYDESILPPAPWLARVHALGPRVYGFVLGLVKKHAARLAAPINDFRRSIGVAAVANPMFDAKHSPALGLAMFSRLIGEPRPDWPANTVVTGFAFYDGAEPDLAPDLAAFLDRGAAPIVFTLGSAAVHDPGEFYAASADAARRLGRRAVLLVGPNPGAVPAASETVGVFGYAPFSKLFPRAAAVVHQGGSGTTGQVMRAGRPMLVVPYAHDQPDNALRARKLGIAASVGRNAYTGETAAAALGPLLGDAAIAARAASVGEIVSRENGAARAADAIERTFRSPGTPGSGL